MRKKYLKTLKQIYEDPQTKERKEYFYDVAVIKDTNGGKYRIINLKDMTIWIWSFDTLNEAVSFLNKHPHNIDNQKGE